VTTIAVVSTHLVTARTDDRSSNSIALFCCVGLALSFCMMVAGLDLSAGTL
jgi:hypothetical protein